MKVKISRIIEKEEEVEIELPYYFEHDMDNSVIYGKIEENKTTMIGIAYYKGYDSPPEFTIEVNDIHASKMESYIKHIYKSTKENYLDAKQKLLEAAINA